MRLSRSSRKKFKKRARLHRVATLLAVSAFGIAQLSTATYALFTASGTQEYVITSAFVFPRTVNDLAASAGQAAQEAAQHRDIVSSMLQSLSENRVTSAEAETLVLTMQEAADKARQAANAAGSFAADLQNYAARSQSDVEQLSISGLQQDTEMKLDSAKKVDAYVQAAFTNAVAASNEANRYADEASSLCAGAAVAAAEIKAAEEQAKKEAEDKAKQEAEEKAKQEAEEQAKQEAEEEAHGEAEQSVDPDEADIVNEQPADTQQPAVQQPAESGEAGEAEQATETQPPVKQQPAETQQQAETQQPDDAYNSINNADGD